NDEPLDFSGQYYQLHEAINLPRPQRPGGPPLLIGGNGPKRTLPLAARYADEWNGVYIPPAVFAERCEMLDELLEEYGRNPQDVRRSLMAGCWFGQTDAEVQAKLDARSLTLAEAHQRGLAVGTASQIVDQLSSWADAGVQRIILQWLDLDDLDGLEALAQAVL
ncbi:MAG TPA: LLM class flavin-dependent oxidoreductase, partial [Anaerolineae bacterium]|nr:LLM class flavin-dependent oxidoreductase [Anaerolineae bacterium]